MENGLVIDHGPVSSGMSIGTSKPPDEQDTRPQYSMPGILHFLQTEWARFEMERSQWEVERAELQARIAFLQGERKGQENLKHDLVRRIKMLEFALKQERAKFHKLKYGSDVNQSELITEKKEEDEFLEPEPINTTNSNATWKQGRQLLRQYLREIGYTDTIIDVRSSRVRQLLGVQAHNAENESDRIIMNGEARRGSKKLGPSIGESALLDSESSVLATFDFLMSEQGGEDEKLAGDEDHENEDDEDNDRLVKRQRKDNTKSSGNESLADADAEDALAEFDFLESSDAGAGEARTDSTQWEKKDMSPGEEWDVDQQLISKLKEQYKKERKAGQKRLTLQSFIDNLGKDVDMADIDSTNATPATPANTGVVQQQAVQPNSVDMADTSNGLPKSNLGSDEDALDAALGLGDLAGLTVSNDEDLSYDISPSSKEACRKTWNAKYTLRSHFDGVRALAFHPVDPVLITASEDHTLKLWNLQKSVPTKKTTSLDVEPVYTFRGHCGAVLCVKMCPTGEVCYSAGLDAAIRCWNLPSTNIDPYDSYDPSVLGDTLIAHTDAVWGLAVHSISHNLLSCSADGTVRLWNPNNKTLLNTFRVEEEEGVPTSVDFVSCDSNQMLAAYSSSNAYLFDLETAKQIVHFDSNQEGDTEPGDQINTIISHPTLPITITGHENRHIRFFDNNTGKVIHSMVAHLDAVTSLAVDPNGLYLLSGSHDSSIRLWNLDSKTCVQEITSHRRKFDESIYDVAFHSSKPYLASAGADALAKVFV